jgi:deferrochelatase/peroxidase EfeB
MTTRRTFMAGIGATLGAGAAVGGRRAEAATAETAPFHAPHQSGIATPQQSHIYFVVFDVVTDRRDDLVHLMQSWTLLAARLTAGLPADELGHALGEPPSDSGEALDLGRAGLTLTFGFGPELFTHQGKDRFGVAARRPAALVDLPPFPGDQFDADKTGGAIAIQACANDPQVAFHAVRQLARAGDQVVAMKWTQAGFCTKPEGQAVPRNLMGFRDGIMNPAITDPKAMEQFVWVGAEGPGWMQGGSYLVARRIRIALQHWDQMRLGFQEQVIGRRKYSGAPLGGDKEFAPLDLKATGPDGNPAIPENAHARLGAPALNGGVQILRRSYSYSDGVSYTAERWPPWRQAMEYDAGLLFMAYQKDPRAGFIRIFEPMSRLDALNQFTTHVGSGIFACPGGVKKGSYIGQRLLETS